ncbi:MAG TPA: L-threonine 3-dehydrogenase [Waddliaceae bacterium]
MRSIVKKYSKPGLWMEDSPIPKLEDNEVLIKIRKTSICGTDLNIDKWGPWAQKNVPVPLIIGHEFVGEIAEVGKNVKNLQIGERVSGEGHITCGYCPNCRKGLKHICMNVRGVGYHRTGCFAEYFTLPAENVFSLPAFIDDDIAAIFDPYGNAVHTALSYNLIGEDILITGAGPIGIMSAAIAQKAGARRVVITDINNYRLALAKKMGISYAVNVNSTSIEDIMREAGIQDGFTVGLEMSGNPQALATLLEKAQHGAHIALLGILPPQTQIDWDLVIFKMLVLKGIYGREIFGTWFKMINLLDSGLNLHPLVTHQYPAEDFEKGFEAMRSGNCGKVILNWV